MVSFTTKATCHALWLLRGLNRFQHDVAVTPSESKAVDACTLGRRGWPWSGLGCERDVPFVTIYARIDSLNPDRCRDNALLQSQRNFDDTGESTRPFAMPQIWLDATYEHWSTVLVL